MSKRFRRRLPPFDTVQEPARSEAETDSGKTAFIPPDERARKVAVDPTRNVVLEASAGTGKTSVLVTRYLNLLSAGVDPANVLAITFTRQAASEMRERIVRQLKCDAATSQAAQKRWAELRDQLSEVAISTVDAFCLSLLREFPLEAGLEPGFTLVDDTEIPCVVQRAVQHTLVIGGAIAHEDDNVSMLLAQLGPWRTRVALAHLLRRRVVVSDALRSYLVGTPNSLGADTICRFTVTDLADRLEGSGLLERLFVDGFTDSGQLSIVVRDLKALRVVAMHEPARIRAVLERLRSYFLTLKGTPRRTFSPGQLKPGTSRHRRFRDAAVAIAPVIQEVLRRFDRDVNVVLVRGAQRLFMIAVSEYRRELASRNLLDFSDVLERAVNLLRQMDEFSRSRYRLESRYHHVLVDELQDTSRAQWELVSLLVQSWGEGSGLVHEAPLPPSIFVVGDRKQSIYRFRDAEVAVLQDAAADVKILRQDGDESTDENVCLSISYSFRAVPELLSFFNDLFAAVDKSLGRADAFRFDAQDHFPVVKCDRMSIEPILGVALADTVDECAARVSGEVVRLLEEGEIRDRNNGQIRTVVPSDIAVLFRSRESHRAFERALVRCSIPTCVYKGLGFSDAEEVKDARALMRYLANPTSELRTAALLRSRFIGLSDRALAELAGRLVDSLLSEVPEAAVRLDDDDRCLLTLARESVPEWLGLVDQLTPAEVLDHIIAGSAYLAELGETPAVQEWENLKKIRGLVRRAQNRGYATMSRISEYIDHLSGDISNAVVDAFEAVNLMTVHSAKGLEFPIVILVDLGRGTGTQSPPIRVVTDTVSGRPSLSVWPFRTAVDDDERASDFEESKRLLYVAATRARDRLYFTAITDKNRIKVNRGSLGEVLPGPFLTAMERAVGTESPFEWLGPSGDSHRFEVLGLPGAVTPLISSQIRNTL